MCVCVCMHVFMLVHMPSGHPFESAQREQCSVAEPPSVVEHSDLSQKCLCSL